MPTKRVDAYHCGTVWSGWLDGAHPTLRMVKFTGQSALVIVPLVANTQ